MTISVLFHESVALRRVVPDRAFGRCSETISASTAVGYAASALIFLPNAFYLKSVALITRRNGARSLHTTRQGLCGCLERLLRTPGVRMLTHGPSPRVTYLIIRSHAEDYRRKEPLRSVHESARWTCIAQVSLGFTCFAIV